ncbi:MAG: hypothetical protein ACHP6H_02300 [Legionellales bacterium]
MKKILFALFIISLPLLLSQCASSNPCGSGGCGSSSYSGDACCGSNSYTGNWY